MAHVRDRCDVSMFERCTTCCHWCVLVPYSPPDTTDIALHHSNGCQCTNVVLLVARAQFHNHVVWIALYLEP